MIFENEHFFIKMNFENEHFFIKMNFENEQFFFTKHEDIIKNINFSTFHFREEKYLAHKTYLPTW